ncbi:hypothetical protein [Sphingobium lignivorans]|uniref:O-antigen polysaccharide polymerase Wzy n=1 Tax=Sphingobium lignivorans TaxID=2735886 RepID=A0ABR6NEE6_9SPHN|nr:hypothetical protein [Sphingobium lignivorans]MBB5985653.1 hypothetical protein [Sphingobium lignivorans]
MTSLAMPAMPGAAAHAPMQNPFVPISNTARLLVMIYFIFWRMLPALAAPAGQSIAFPALALTIAFAHFLTQALMLLPFLVRRFAGTPVGWLHPLVLTATVMILFEILGRPEALLAPVAMWFPDITALNHPLLVGWSDTHVMEARVKLSLLQLLGIVSAYAGFALVARKGKRPRMSPPLRIEGWKIALLFCVGLAIVLLFLQLQGGIVAHMSTLAGGRFGMRTEVGHYLVLNAFLPIILILWYAYRPQTLGKPLFIAAFALAAVMQFVATGSRSGLFAPVAMLLAVWIYHNHKLPKTGALLAGLAALLLLGVLGEIRRSGNQGEVDFSSLTQFDPDTAFAMSAQERENRDRDTDLAVAALVPTVQGHLWGATYVSAAAFWVPRAIWPDKPRGAGAYAAALLFGNQGSMEGYSGVGYPVNGVAEAYWNFSVPGVVLVYLLFGMMLHALTRWIMRDPDNPFAVTTLVVIAFSMTQPNSISLVDGSQRLALLYLVYLFAARRTA